MMSAPPVDQADRDRIRNDLGSTIFVEAGAGTGKTRELIERILRLVISERAELRGIAAITFTEAAAAELRDRIRTRLEQVVQDEASHAAEQRERCAAALEEVDAAAIETLHAFAQRILASHPIEAGLPPLIEVQDEIRASIAFQERWDEFFEELLEDPALEETLVRAFSLGLRPDQLREVAWKLHENWDRLAGEPTEEPHLPPVDVSLLARALADVCAHMPRCTDTSDRLYEHLLGVDRYQRRLENASTDIERLRILTEKTGLRTQGGQAPNWPGVAPDDIRRALRSADERRDNLLRGAKQAVLSSLLAALRRFVLAYADERRRQGRLEFHDLLVQCRNLLRDNQAVRRAVQARFSHLLIDEFQDTDPLQIEIAVLLADDASQEVARSWEETSVRDGRLFFVGDPKQSIYRFRRADIALYQKAQRCFGEGTVRLSESFRAVPPLIDWVNGIIGPLIHQDEHAGQASYVALHPSRQSPDGAATRVTVLGGPASGNVASIREREAKEIARLIQSVKADAWTAVEKDESGDEQQRPANYQDIAILIPTRTTLPPIEQALEAAGVPYRVESQSLVYNTQEVRDLLAILRCIDDPTDEVALIAALRSPAFACADDDLLRFRQAGGRWDYRLAAPDSLPADDPVADAMRALHELHRRRWWETISGVVEAVIRERRLFELAFAHRRPREHWQRLRFLLDQARAFAEAGGATLRQFIDWAERQADEGTRVVETAVPEPDDDAVRIMTVHAAKGLEFPIVLLAGLNLEAPRGSQQGATVLWDDDGRLEGRLGGADGFETPGYEALATREKEMDRQEKIRLLYVAATRARDHLIVSLHHKEDRDSHARLLYERCAEALDLWQPAALRDTPERSEQREPLPFEDGPEQRRAWLETRQQRIEALARAPFQSATGIAQSAAGASDDLNLRKETPVEEAPPWRRGRAGTAFGRAVHAVLQSIDLAAATGLESAASAQAAAEGIAGRTDEIARTVAAALEAKSVRQAAKSGRYWRELYVAAPIDGTTIEGFVDLLYETPDGLVVVDYKTDAVPGENELAAAMARYRLQGAAYALALQQALGRPVARCVFVFARPGRTIEREIDDLPAAIEAVRRAVARQ